MKQDIAGTYEQLLSKHEDPFRSITKSTTHVSLMIITAIMEDFKYITKALLQMMEIMVPSQVQKDLSKSAIKLQPWQ
jgi:hypothetical protein